MSVAPLILLIGPRAAGKTTVGRGLAARLGRGFVDLDDLVLLRLGHDTVSAAWDALGEPGWRAAEHDALIAGLGHLVPCILALGGGAVLDERSRAAIRDAAANGRAVVVYLRCSAEVVTARLRRDAGDRPTLTGGDPAEEAAAVLAAREPIYREVADVVVDATGDPDVVADRIVTAINAI